MLISGFDFRLLVQDSRKYTGIVEDCCCDYETVDSINGEVLHPLLQELVTTPFFRYFKVWWGLTLAQCGLLILLNDSSFVYLLLLLLDTLLKRVQCFEYFT